MNTRRMFLKFLGAGTAVAPAVKSAASLPDHESKKFAGGFASRPLDIDSILSRIVSVHDATAYDRIRLNAGSRVPFRIEFFQQPIGGVCRYSGITKTESDTSMRQSGQFAAPWELLAQRILFTVHPSANDADLDALSSEAYWSFHLLQKNIARGPVILNSPARAVLSDVVAPFESRPESHDTALTRDGLPSNVLASAYSARGTGGIFVPSLCYFRVDIETPKDVVLRGDLDLLIGLQGLECTAVQ